MPQVRARHCVAAGLVLAAALVATSAAWPTGLGFPRPDFELAYVHSRGPSWATGDVFVMDADGSDQRNLSQASALDDGPVWSPDGRRIAFLSRRDGRQEIYGVNADGTGLRNLTRNSEHDFAPAWSPDGQRIVYTKSPDRYQRATAFYVMNADGSGQRLLLRVLGPRDPGWLSGAAWSPDGRQLVFTAPRDGAQEVFVMNGDGGGLRNLTRNPSQDIVPTWLPDGRIAFTSNRDGTWQLYVMNAAGLELRNLTQELGLPAQATAWSPSGRKVSFVRNYSLYVMNADGSGQRQLVGSGIAHDSGPVWSPDGQQIAFVKSVGGWERGSSEIFVVNVDGSGLRRLTRRPGHDYGPVWSPVRR